MLLKGKTAVITGSNKGIGLKTLEIFSENGATIFACARNINVEFNDLIKNLENKFKNKIIPIKLDLSNESSIKDACNNILNTKINVDILVNNAATIHTALFQMTSLKKLKEIFEINFFSQTTFTQFILKSMIKNKKGSIVYISSSSAMDGNEGRSAYASTKSAIISQAKVLSRELGPHNIRVNSISPGLTDTDMMKENHKKEKIDEVISRTSLRRVAKATEIANIILLLSSDLTSYITGQNIRVDGGM